MSPTSRPTRRQFLAGAAALTLAAPATAAPARDEKLPTGVIVLDDCDEEFKGKDAYADLDRTTGHLWVVTEEEILKVDRKGEVLARGKHEAPTKQAWIAAY
jgi:hypothetical protein